MTKSFQHLSFQKGLLFVAFFLGICQVGLAQTVGGSATTIEPNTSTTKKYRLKGVPSNFPINAPTLVGKCDNRTIQVSATNIGDADQFFWSGQ